MGAYVDGIFGAAFSADALLDTVDTVGSLSQSNLDHLSDTILISDAGSFDMGFLTTTTAPVGNATTPACVTDIAPSPYTTGGQVYAGPWARKNVTGSWAGGKDCIFATGQQGNTTFAAADGSAKSMSQGGIYQIKYTAANAPVVWRMYVNAAQ
jgi:hypothetical protein